MNYWWFFLTAGLISLVLTAGLRRYALAKSIIDVPNARSSHSQPTPRGGGVAIVVTFVLATPVLVYLQLMTLSQAAALVGAGLLVAIVGFMDDHGHIAARWRLLGHFTASVWALWWLGGLPVIHMFGTDVHLGWIGHGLAALYLVWLLNLYNFMDGIDGIASVEAICVCLGSVFLYWLDDQYALIAAPLLLSMTVAGFLYWNFPPAKIFMGDAGSGFLGLVLGILSVQAAWASSQLFWAWLMLLGVFIVDATFTLMRRLIRGDKVYEAHRSHAYQYASRIYGRHLPITVAVMLINLFWLLPLAIASLMFGWDGLAVLLVAYAPLVALAVKFHAGEHESAS